MQKEVLESILLANSYLIACKFSQASCNKSELARKYLLKKVQEALLQKKNLSKHKNLTEPLKSEDLR